MVFLTLWSHRVASVARDRDRIRRCVGRTGYPARKPIRKAPAQKARRGHLRVLTPRTSSEADPSILFLKTRTPPKPIQAPAGVGLRNRSGLQIRRQPRAPLPAGQGL